MGGCVGKSVVTCVWPQVQINWVKDEKLWEGKIWSVAWRGLWCVRVWWRWPFHIFLIGCVIRTKQNSRLLSFVIKKEKKRKKKNPRPSVRLKLCRLSDWRKKNWPTPVHQCNSTAVTKRLKKRIIIISLSFSVSAVIFLLFLYFLSSFFFYFLLLPNVFSVRVSVSVAAAARRRRRRRRRRRDHRLATIVTFHRPGAVGRRWRRRQWWYTHSVLEWTTSLRAWKKPVRNNYELSWAELNWTQLSRVRVGIGRVGYHAPDDAAAAVAAAADVLLPFFITTSPLLFSSLLYIEPIHNLNRRTRTAQMGDLLLLFFLFFIRLDWLEWWKEEEGKSLHKHSRPAINGNRPTDRPTRRDGQLIDQIYFTALNQHWEDDDDQRPRRW